MLVKVEMLSAARNTDDEIIIIVALIFWQLDSKVTPIAAHPLFSDFLI